MTRRRPAESRAQRLTRVFLRANRRYRRRVDAVRPAVYGNDIAEYTRLIALTDQAYSLAARLIDARDSDTGKERGE